MLRRHSRGTYGCDPWRNCPKFIHSLDIRRNRHGEENLLGSQDELLSRIFQGAFVDDGNENVCLTAEHQVGQVTILNVE